MLTVKEWEKVRRMYHTENKSLREIERETGYTYRTLRKAVDSETPPVYKKRENQAAPVLGPYKDRIKELLEESKNLPRKQRYTSSKIYELLKQEGYVGAESTVRHHISQVRKAENRPKFYLPLSYEVGEDAQVDWGEATIIHQGKREKANVFVMSLSYSRRKFVCAYPSMRQECFFDGHVKAFEFFGGVPKRISYDNLKTAVKKVLTGKGRIEQESFLKFRGYYVYDSNYCAPAAGNEKGIVEAGVGYSQRKYFAPLPEVDSYAELNDYLYRACLADDERTVKGQPKSVGEMWQEEKAALREVPEQPFQCCRTVEARVTKYSQVTVETNRYSVPVERAGQNAVVKLYPFQVKIYTADGQSELAIHERCYGKEEDCFNPHHYLSLLSQRPGALTYATPIRQWRNELPAVYEELLAHLQQKWPDNRGVREFIAILQLHLVHPAEQITEAVTHALEYNCAHLDGVTLCLNQLLHPEPEAATLDLSQRPHLSAIGEQGVDFAPYDTFFFGSDDAPPPQSAEAVNGGAA